MDRDITTLDDLHTALKRLSGVVRRTPLIEAPFLSERAGRRVHLKCENLQLTGAFKIRGAVNHVMALDGVSGVVTASSGNHGQAVAWACRAARIPCTVVMPVDAVGNKLDGIQRLGARILRHGTLSSERKELARAMAEDENLSFVDSTDDPLVIAGQGTLALEILDQLPGVEAVVSPIGGGGLISGISAAVKLSRPGVSVVGVEPRGAAAMHASIAAGQRVALDRVETVADGLRTVRPGPLTFAHVKAFVDHIVLADEPDIVPMMVSLAREAKLVVEPSGAVGPCGLDRLDIPGTGPVVVVISGGNVDLPFFARCLEAGA